MKRDFQELTPEAVFLITHTSFFDGRYIIHQSCKWRRKFSKSSQVFKIKLHQKHFISNKKIYINNR